VVDRVLSSQLADIKGMTAYLDQKKKIKDEFDQRPVQDPFRCLVPKCIAHGLASSCRVVRSNPNLNPNFHPNPTPIPTLPPLHSHCDRTLGDTHRAPPRPLFYA
jgi:hypothetical protein